MRAGGQPAARGVTAARRAARQIVSRLASAVTAGRIGATPLTIVATALLLLALVAATPLVAATSGVAQAQQQFQVWRSPQFGMKLSHPTNWTVVEQRADPERGDVLILGNETSALLVGLLTTPAPHARWPRI